MPHYAERAQLFHVPSLESRLRILDELRLMWKAMP